MAPDKKIYVGVPSPPASATRCDGGDPGLGDWESLGAVIIRVLERMPDETLPPDRHRAGSPGEDRS